MQNIGKEIVFESDGRLNRFRAKYYGKKQF